MDSDSSDDSSSSDDDFEFDVPAPIVPKPSIVEIVPKASKLTKWEELQAEINQMRMGNPPPRSDSPDSQKSQKNLTRKNSRDSLHEERPAEEDDNGSALYLSNLYHENSQTSLRNAPTDEQTGDAIDELLKNIEDEMKVEDVEEE